VLAGTFEVTTVIAELFVSGYEGIAQSQYYSMSKEFMERR